MRTFAGLLVAMGLAVLVACGGGGDWKTNQKAVDAPPVTLPEKGPGADFTVAASAEPAPRPKDPAPAEAKAPAPKVADDWSASSKSVEQGDVRVTIARVRVGKVETEHLGRPSSSQEDLLQVEVVIENLSPTRKLDYRGWGSDSFGLGFPARAEDELGNHYSRITFGFGSDVVGQVRSSESIYPQKSIRDLLVFETPVAAATDLRLMLPGEAFGGKGALRLKLPLEDGRPKRELPPQLQPKPPKTDEEIEAELKAKAIEDAEMEAEHKAAHEKGAASKLRAAESLLKLGKKDAYRRTLKELIEKYPDTEAAEEAAKLLEKTK